MAVEHGDDRERFFELEDALDARALATGFARLPRRTLLAIALGTAHDLCQGSYSGAPARFGDGRALISRLSYLTEVIEAGDPDALGASAVDVLSPLQDPQLQQDVRYLYLYAHLCELLPEIRRGSWVVTGSAEAGFALTHPSDEFANFEARDVVLSELALTAAVRPPTDSGAFDRIVTMLPGTDLGFQMATTKEYYEWFLNTILEQPLFGDAGMQEAFGVSTDSFNRFRAVWMAWAEYILGMTAALSRRLRADPTDTLAVSEYPEWQVPCLNANFVEGSSIALSQLPSEEWDRLMNFFVYRTEPNSNAGDGFFPPIHRLAGTLLFSADALQGMMPMRNMAYAMNRLERKVFDDVLSHHLEPQLLREAAEVLGTLPGVRVALNINWDDGEIDLAAVDVEHRFILSFEAKAPLPPQGARMTAATQSRVAEGLDQINRFRQLDVEQQAHIVGSELGEDLSGARVTYGLLARSCLGTAAVWTQLGDVVPSNPQLLQLAVSNLLDRGGRLEELPQELVDVLDSIVGEVARGWRPANLDLELTSLDILLLDLDEEAMSRHRVAAAVGLQQPR